MAVGSGITVVATAIGIVPATPITDSRCLLSRQGARALSAKPKHRTTRRKRRIEALALQICEAVVELTRHRKGRGQQFVMRDSVEKHLGVPREDLQAAVAFAVERSALEEKHGSIAVHRQHLIGRVRDR